MNRTNKQSSATWLVAFTSILLSAMWLVALFIPLSEDFDPYGHNRALILIGIDLVLILMGVVFLAGACIRKRAYLAPVFILGIPVVHIAGYFLPEPMNTMFWIIGTLGLCIGLVHGMTSQPSEPTPPTPNQNAPPPAGMS